MSSNSSCGCCLGMIFGFILALAILVAACFGVYCYFNPDARNSSIDVVETQWGKIKSGGDEIIEHSRNVGEQPPAAKPAPEPQVIPAGRNGTPANGRPLPLAEPSR